MANERPNESPQETERLDTERGMTEREIGGLQSWIKSVDSKLDCLLAAWEGNGKPGLKRELVNIHSRLDALEKWKGSMDSALRYFAIAFALFCAGVLWGILTDKIDIILR